LAADSASQPVNGLADWSDTALVWVNAALTGIAEAQGAEDGVVAARQFGAEVRGSFFAMDQTGDHSRSERVVVKHGYDNIINLNC
jgi:hypothetical protein